jgi:hypothetical protein
VLPAGYSWSFTTVATPAPHIAVTDSIAPIDDHAVPFGDIMAGTTQDQTVTVTNSGTANLVIDVIGGTDPLAGPFMKIMDHCSQQTLTPSASCTVMVRFAPTIAGAANDSFNIPSNDPGTPSVTMNVSGNGTPVPVPHIAVADTVAPVDDHAIAFGDMTVGQTQDQTVTVTNSGNADLVIGAIGGVDALAGPFSIIADNCSGQTLAPASGCTVTVRFAPSVAGAANDSFNIPSNDPGTPSVTMNVSGNGLAATATGNNPPSVVALVFPADGQAGVGTPVTFRWEKSVDPDGDAVSYQLYTCTDQTFAGCDPTTVASLPRANHLAGLGGYGAGLLFFGFIFAGGTKGGKKILLLLALVIVTGTLVVSCGGGGGGGGESAPSAGPAPVVESSSQPQALAAGTTYYWKVVAVDSKGSATSSDVWRFVTQ